VTQVAVSGTSLPFRVPSVIKRNMVLFALSQTFTGAGMQFAYGFGPLILISPLLGGIGPERIWVDRGEAGHAFALRSVFFDGGRPNDRGSP
jgi:hypothetical protein